MLVFWHCQNLNGPQLDCEINISLRLIVGVGCHSHHFQSYCLSGIQREQDPTWCTRSNQHLLLCLFLPHPNPNPKSQAWFTGLTHFPHSPLSSRKQLGQVHWLWASTSSSLRSVQHGCALTNNSHLALESFKGSCFTTEDTGFMWKMINS